MKRTLLAAVAAAAIVTPARADTYWYCKGEECIGRSAAVAELGTFSNPIEDRVGDGDWSRPVHRGIYCVGGLWHHGWLRPGERSPVIKPSCGNASVYQMAE